MTEFVVLIPARLDSSRLPGKALADIHGKPMVVRVAEQAAKSKAARVVVATDHPDIQTASSGIIFSVPFSLLAAYRLGQDVCRCT